MVNLEVNTSSFFFSNLLESSFISVISYSYSSSFLLSFFFYSSSILHYDYYYYHHYHYYCSDAARGGTFNTINPANGEVITSVAAGTAEDIDGTFQILSFQIYLFTY